MDQNYICTKNKKAKIDNEDYQLFTEIINYGDDGWWMIDEEKYDLTKLSENDYN